MGRQDALEHNVVSLEIHARWPVPGPAGRRCFALLELLGSWLALLDKSHEKSSPFTRPVATRSALYIEPVKTTRIDIKIAIKNARACHLTPSSSAVPASSHSPFTAFGVCRFTARSRS